MFIFQRGGDQMKILISTIWKGSAVIQAIKLFSPNKVFFIADEPVEDIRNNSINMIKELFPNLEYKTVSTKIYDIVGIAKSVMDIIESETGNEIIVHISEGRKTMGLGLLFGAYVKRELVSSAYYITEENSQLLSLPLLSFGVGESKKKLLTEISKGNGEVKKIEKKLSIGPSAVYQHVQELKDEGYLEKDKELKLTDLGRIMIL